MLSQLPLGIRVNEQGSFENFVAGDNTTVVELLARVAEGGGEPAVYVWGGVSSGKTHLLHAVCRRAHERGRRVVYLPLLHCRDELSSAMLDELDALDVVCIDDVQSIAGVDEWEAALFNFYNRIRDAGGALVVAAQFPPRQLSLRLADLTSRLGNAVVWRLRPLTDEQKLIVLQQCATQQGLLLDAEVGQYMLRHWVRDLPSLLRLFERLDYVSLSRQRRLTIPLVREVMEQNRAGTI